MCIRDRRISAMNLMLHSITNPEIDYKDSVSKQNSICSKYTVCLANPPFKGTVDAESINDDLKAVTNTKKTELLFLALFLDVYKRQSQRMAEISLRFQSSTRNFFEFHRTLSISRRL